MRDLTSEAKGYDINFTYRGKVFHINSSRLGQTREKLKQFGIEVYQLNKVNCIYLPDEKRAVGEIWLLDDDTRAGLKIVEDCTNFSESFRRCSSTTFLDLRGWDVSQGKYFRSMFYDCSSLIALNLSGWDISQGETFNWMFHNCENLKLLDLSGWDLSNGECFTQMFFNCNSLKAVKAKGCNEFTIKRLRELLPSGCEVVY